MSNEQNADELLGGAGEPPNVAGLATGVTGAVADEHAPAEATVALASSDLTISPLLAGYQGILPFPSHWDGYLHRSTESLFAEARFDEAIRAATLRLEARLRGLCGSLPDRIGVDLVSDAFKLNGGFLEPVQLPSAERDGLHQLFRGAVQQIRNPVGHRDIGRHAGAAFDTIAFINYLLEVAQEAALVRYVYPFLGRWSGPWTMETIHRCDVNGDGASEIVVFVRSEPPDGPKVTTLILSSDGAVSLDGLIATVPGRVLAPPIFEDLDADGRSELIITVGDRDESGSWTWHGSIVDWSAEQDIRSFAGPEDRPLVSVAVQFEVVRPMNVAGPVLAGWTGTGPYRLWQFDGNTLTELEDDNATP